MVEGKLYLLIVEDDLDVAEMLDAYFRVQGYDVKTVNWGEDAINACQLRRPDLILLDIRLPDMDGFDVAQALKSSERTKNIPILFLTEKRTRKDRLLGLELGAEDYITKPFDIQELRLRIKNVMQRPKLGAVNNPITGLPDQVLVDERLNECLSNQDWALLLITLDHYNSFREGYGFVAADDMLRAVTLMLTNAVRKEGNTTDFIGHLNPNQFLVVTTPDTLAGLQRRLEDRFDQNLDYFYPLEDRDGQKASAGERLALSIRTLVPGERRYKNVQALKIDLITT